MTAEKFLAEVFGTGMLILLGDGVVANVLLSKTKGNMNTGVGNSNGWIVITTAWALAVYCGVLIAGPFSGAHLNPAVTIGVAVLHMFNSNAGIPWSSVPGYWAGELIGAMIGAALVALHYWDHFKATDDKGLKLAVFSTGPNIRNLPLNLISEIIGTFVLLFVIFCGAGFAGTSAVVGPLWALGAIPVAFVVWSIGLSLGGTTGYAINPARDLGPRIIHAVLPIPGKGTSDWEYAWVPVVGPLIGGALAAAVYYLAFTNYIAK